MRKILLMIFAMHVSFSFAAKKDYTLTSPNNKLRVTISFEKQILYSISYEEKEYLNSSKASLHLANGIVLGSNSLPVKSLERTVNNVVKPLYGINEFIPENFNELKIDTKQDFSVVFRVYDQGIAYRFETRIPGNIIVESEQADFQFTENYNVYFHPRMSESSYRLQTINDTIKPNYSSLPVLVKPIEGPNIIIHESDVFNYPCLTVEGGAGINLLKGNNSKYPKVVEPVRYNLRVKETEDYIAKTIGTRSFPWRIIAFEEKDIDIVNNQLVYLLASENKLENTSWIKPGKVSWDWWNNLNLTGVPFKAGINMNTYKYFIDFASNNHIEYINLDLGWSDPYDLMKVADNLDLEELIKYGKEKNVGVFLWCVWRILDNQMIPILDHFTEWGVAGVKVDFMDRDDQVVVEFQEKLLKETAKRKMLVNYHGAYHPTGMSRTYPNEINVEGVKGLEWNKFNDKGTSPDHAVTIPYIRMFAGSMDYTPGAMSNYNQQDWKQIYDRPMSQGTRCHQLAMYVVYYGALQMLADSPTEYESEPAVLDLISNVPTIWDETLPLEGEVGQYIAIARRSGNVWYIGALTGWNKKEIEIPLTFLNGKNYKALIYEDGMNSEKNGNDFQIKNMNVTNNSVVSVEMAKGGGWVAKISPVK